MIDALDQGLGVGRRGQEVALEAIEIFDGQHHLVLGGKLGGLPQHVGGVLLLVVGRPVAGEDADGRVIGPAQILAAQGRRHLDRPLDAIEAALRIVASGLTGLVSAWTTVTVVQRRP